jgi:hypothetical protein
LSWESDKTGMTTGEKKPGEQPGFFHADANQAAVTSL